MIAIRPGNLDNDAARQLISDLDDELNRIYPEEGANFLDLDPAEVRGGRGAFFIAWAGEEALGCGAMRLRDAQTAEIKRMYVKPSARARGVGSRLLAALEDRARDLGARQVVLEAGDRQASAIALYVRAGYSRIAPFGEYADAPLSVCMAKDL